MKRALHLTDLLPDLGQTIAVNAQVPLAKIAERSQPHLKTCRAQPLNELSEKILGKLCRRILAAQMSKRVEHDVAQTPLARQPFDVFDALAHDRDPLASRFVSFFGVDKHHDRVAHFCFRIWLLRARQSLRKGLPPKALRLETQKLHRERN